MSRSDVYTILKWSHPGERRAALVDAAGAGWRLFSERFDGEAESLRPGEIIEARVMKPALSQGGVFLIDQASGEEIWTARRDSEGLHEGALCRALILSGARRDKLARARPVGDHGLEEDGAFARWRASITGGEAIAIKEVEGQERRDDLFEDVLSDVAGLPGGGRLYLERTRALLAVDIDRGGREEHGSAGARALSLNRAAVTETVRQILLRDMGGAVVIDCVEPLNRAGRERLQSQFRETAAAHTTRQVDVDLPNRMGLMAASLAWGETPYADRVLDASGQPSGLTVLLEALRDLAREATARPAALFHLHLPQPVLDIYRRYQTACDKIVLDRFGGRATINKSETEQVRLEAV